MEVSSYGGTSTESSGLVRILKDLSASIEGEEVLIVEDIIDTGLTLNYLLRYLRGKNPRSLRVCTLLDKPARRLVDIPVDYLGFTIPDQFVVGYGLDYGEYYRNLRFVGVLRGAVMVMADLARHFGRHLEMDWMAISSYGSGTKSSGVVRILKDLDTDISDRHVLIVEDIIDTGLTLSWLVSNLTSRGPASVEIVTLLRKPEALQMSVDVKYVGYDIPNEFVVGYGLDYSERYRNLRSIGTLAPHVYS